MPAVRGSDSASDAPASECVKVDQQRTWSPTKSPKGRDEPAAAGMDVPMASLDGDMVRVCPQSACFGIPFFTPCFGCFWGLPSCPGDEAL